MILTSFVPAFYQAKISDFLTSNYDAVSIFLNSKVWKCLWSPLSKFKIRDIHLWFLLVTVMTKILLTLSVQI